MKVPLTIVDHLRRAELVYPDRIGVVDEPDQPAPSWGSVTYARRGRAGPRPGRRARRARRRPGRAGRDRLPQLGPAADVGSSACSGSGRVLVPINFRLVAEEVALHRRALRRPRAARRPRARRRAGGRDGRAPLRASAPTPTTALLRHGVEPQPWAPDEDATATINYTSGTTARPKGVQLTHRNLWLNATTFGWQLGVSDRDVYLHTLPMFHCNGWGMPYADDRHGREAT